MEGKRGGRTPRGRTPRGGQRGRGQGSPAASPSSSVTSSPAKQTGQTPVKTATPQPRGEQPKVTQQTMETPSSVQPAQAEEFPPLESLSQPVTDKPPEAKQETKTTSVPEKEQKTSDLEEPDKPENVEKQQDQDKTLDDLSPPAFESSTEVDVQLETKEIPRKESLDIPKPDPNLQGKVAVEEKVEKALGKKQKQRPVEKTLIVEPTPEPARAADAPVSVEIDPGVIASPGEAGTATLTQRQQRHSRSGSVSPGYSYPLYGPVGKPGYIGGVGCSDEEAGGASGDPNRPGLARRESALAAMEAAVKGFTKRQWILLVMFGLIDMLAAITISLQAPFYPAEAEKKGATPTEYGFVFGIFEFIVFLTSPLFGKYVHKIGPKTVFTVCIFITSVSVICFGLLDQINDHTTFISLCFVCRIFEALGCAGFFTSTFVIIAIEFPETVATTFASLETFFGLGMILGPTIGGALFSVGGFPLPFFVVGGCLLATGLLSGLVMPKIDTNNESPEEEERDYGILTILRIPSITLAALSIAATSMGLGFVSATLEPHLRKFALTPLQIGLIFIINGGVYALTAPLFGYICDYIRRPIYITVLGNIFIFIAFLLIGPAPFMPFDTILWVTIIGLVIQGLGFGCCLVAGFIVGLKESVANGFPDNIATYGVASGLWTSMVSLGAWVGPSIGGVLFDLIGFRQGSLVVLGTTLLVGTTIFVYACVTSGSSSDSESQPLLGSSSIPPLIPEGLKESEKAGKPSTSYGSTSQSGSGNV